MVSSNWVHAQLIASARPDQMWLPRQYTGKLYSPDRIITLMCDPIRETNVFQEK